MFLPKALRLLFVQKEDAADTLTKGQGYHCPMQIMMGDGKHDTQYF